MDLGFTEITFQSAMVNYDMSKCADIDLTENISCGVCVPCEVDADCQPIGIDPLIMQMFNGEPLAQIAGALLTILLGSVLGLILGVPYTYIKGKLTRLGTYLPLGVFLAMGGAVAYVFGDALIDWYLRTMVDLY